MLGLVNVGPRAARGGARAAVAGDEAGTLGGVLSSSTRGEAEFVMYLLDVKLERKRVYRIGEPLFPKKMTR